MTAQLAAEWPTIKILLYTDDPSAITDGNKFLGLSSMIERLKAHAPTFAQIEPKWVSRSSTNNLQADNKLNMVLEKEVAETGKPFDEIWFFGLHQANTSGALLGGGPENELDDAEIEALTRWMRINEDGTGGIGVLMTGDHNNPPPPNRIFNGNQPAGPPEGALLGLGRALGKGVPRAGALRQWDGPPSSLPADNLSTLATIGFQTDRQPQVLSHQRFNANGALDPAGKVHPLFFYRSENELIDVFPDHGHEGLLVIPDALDERIWPRGQNGQPKPDIVAFGTDKRTGNAISILTTYDGDAANVGRIVADSSWHHYVNINLRGFPHPAPVPSDSDKIGQFYGNLAVWLAPRHKRLQMAQTMEQELGDYTFIQERGAESQLGDVADLILQRAAAPCEAYELLKMLSLNTPRSASFSTNSSGQRTDPRRELLGSVLNSYHEAIQASQLAAADSGFDTTSGVARRRRNEMGCNADSREWTIKIEPDRRPDGTALGEKVLVFCLNNQEGIVTGEVSDGDDGTFLSTVTGNQQSAFDQESIGFMSLEFEWNGAGVMLDGATLKTPETTLFAGRFRTTEPLSLNGNGHARTSVDAVVLVPGSGDTGSGSGQTT